MPSEPWLEHLTDTLSAGGPLLPVLAIVSAALWTTFLSGRRRLVMILRAADEFSATSNRHPSGTSLLAALFHHNEIAPDTPEALARHLERTSTSLLRLLGRNLLIVGALTAAAPLLGLLGTVVGMVNTFDAVGQLSGDASGRIASGISQALITTQYGLIVALPGVFGLARLQRLMGHVEARLALCRQQILMPPPRCGGPAPSAQVHP